MSAPPCSPLLDPELVAFLQGGLGTQVGTASDDGTPAITRGHAIRVSPDARTVDVFIGRAQSVACLANFAPGRLIAVGTGNPLDFRGIQIKGTVVACQETDAGDDAWIARHDSLFEAKVTKVGMAPAGNTSFRSQEYLRVTFVPTLIYRQTPGPGAGNPLDAGP